MRGDVYRFRPNDKRGHKQSGARFAVVLQSDDLLLSTALVAPTSTSARGTVFRPTVEINGQPTQVMTEQITVIDPQGELGERVGRLSPREMLELDEAIKLVLGLF
ncbi:MAG: type II toxin-antitoxin system PemK/MazF family toxin [Promicromonosporaceae bacterium]|nr:type II toxin-antitoxin system PemK/MazF family toxin [Promicromonosporaceae bacterium]